MTNLRRARAESRGKPELASVHHQALQLVEVSSLYRALALTPEPAVRDATHDHPDFLLLLKPDAGRDIAGVLRRPPPLALPHPILEGDGRGGQICSISRLRERDAAV
jgi:hypothetical protein